MSHPTHEELLEFLDAELPPERQAAVAEHVATCDECRRLTESWRGAHTALASWELAERPLATPTFETATISLAASQRPTARSGWRRAAAAAALVAAGFGLALLAAPSGDSAQHRAELASEVRRQVQEELHAELAKFTATQDANHEEFLTALNGRLDELELQWLVDYVELRRDVETVAIGAEEGLRRLAAGATPENSP